MGAGEIYIHYLTVNILTVCEIMKYLYNMHNIDKIIIRSLNNINDCNNL